MGLFRINYSAIPFLGKKMNSLFMGHKNNQNAKRRRKVNQYQAFGY